MDRESLLTRFPEDKVDKILNIKSGDVTFDMLSNGQKNVFVAIASLIEKNMRSKPPKNHTKVSSSEDIMSIFGQEKRHVTLNGMAGSGKTTLMKFIVEYIKMSGYIGKTLLCAPNHNARKILSSYTGVEASTIHRLLKIKPDNYELERSFSRMDTDKSANPLVDCRILIIDEISFIDELLFDILMAEIPPNCIIIGLGNMDQLMPIPPKNAKGRNGVSKVYEAKLSPFFTDERFYKLGLTEIRRSNSPVAVISEAIRKKVITFPQKDYVNEAGDGVHVFHNIQDFLKVYYEKVQTPEDFKQNRIVAFSNADVDMLNSRIRRKIYDTTDEFVEGEILVAQAPYFETDDENAYYENRLIHEEMLFQNGTYLEVISCSGYTEIIQIENLEPLEVRGYELRVRELDVFFEAETDSIGEFTVNVLSYDSKDAYAQYIEMYAQELMNQKKRKERPNWRMFYYFADKKFLDFKYLPACTIHKSQGITVDNLFYYVDFVRNMSDQDMARRLTYVAVTRSRYNSYLLY